MRVQGNISPETITVETYHPITGYAEVRLRENIKAFSAVDQTTGTEITMYEYDEYVFHLKDKEGLKEEIEANMSDWLATGRSMEVNDNASELQDMKEALGILLGEVNV